MAKDKIRKIIFYSLIIFFGLASTILFYFLLKNQTSSESITKKVFLVLRPFIIGGVLAYIMKSTCNFFERIYKKGLLKSGKRTEKKASKTANILSLITTYVIWISVVVVLIAIVAQPLIESITNLIKSLVENVDDYAANLINFIHNKLEGYPEIQDLFEGAVHNVEMKFYEWVETDLPALLKDVGTQIIFGVVDIVVLIKDIFIGLVVSFLLLAGRKVLAAKSKIFVRCIFKEKAANAIIDEFKFADKMFSGFLEGKVIDSAIIGVLYYIALLIMDISYAPLIAVICGITNIIPIFGPFIGAIPSGLIILSAEDPIKLLWFIIFVCIMQFIDGNIIDPHIVGGNIKISGFSVLFAVILFGGLWGFAGLLVGVPVFAVIYDIGKKLVAYILKKKNQEHLLDEYREQFPPKEKQEKQKKPRPATAMGDDGCADEYGECDGSDSDVEINGDETNDNTEDQAQD